ncbi:MAG: hypothetical protein R6V04_16725 [bacterium]
MNKIRLFFKGVEKVIYDILIFFGLLGGIKYFFEDGFIITFAGIFLSLITIGKLLKRFGFRV